MTGLIAFIKLHPTAFTLGLYYMVSAAVGSLPMPDAESHKFYRWFFQFSNTLAANVTRAYASKLPNLTPPSVDKP
jgi:hypothetical protein